MVCGVRAETQESGPVWLQPRTSQVSPTLAPLSGSTSPAAPPTLSQQHSLCPFPSQSILRLVLGSHNPCHLEALQTAHLQGSLAPPTPRAVKTATVCTMATLYIPAAIVGMSHNSLPPNPAPPGKLCCSTLSHISLVSGVRSSCPRPVHHSWGYPSAWLLCLLTPAQVSFPAQ